MSSHSNDDPFIAAETAQGHLRKAIAEAKRLAEDADALVSQAHQPKPPNPAA